MTPSEKSVIQMTLFLNASRKLSGVLRIRLPHAGIEPGQTLPPIHFTNGMLLLVPYTLLVAAVAAQWNGVLSVAVADSVSYIRSGVSLISSGRYESAFGDTELWFPPLYPALIGLLDLIGANPLTAGRVISLLAALATLCVVAHMASRLTDRATALWAGVVLVCCPVYQQAAAAALSEATATMFMVTGTYLWISRTERSSLWRTAAIGLAAAASYLTRPEAILVAALWASYDIAVRTSRSRLHALVLIAAFVIPSTPYVLWLSKSIGQPAISGKGDVNLAAGRAQYYQVPRERIDSETLEMEFARPEMSASSEARRYTTNLAQLARSIALNIDTRVTSTILLLPLVVGLGVSIRRLQIRAIFGLVAPLAVVPVIAWYAPGERYLHMTMPTLAVFTGIGIVSLVRLAASTPPLAARIAAVFVLAFCFAVVLERGTRSPRWSLSEETRTSLLKEAGERLHLSRPCRVFEAGATIGYYAGCRRGRLTSDDLAVLKRYADATTHAGEATFIAVDNEHADTYHESVAALLEKDSAPLTSVLGITDARGQVVIYKLD